MVVLLISMVTFLLLFWLADKASADSAMLLLLLLFVLRLWTNTRAQIFYCRLKKNNL